MTVHPERTHDNMSEHLDTLSGPTSMAYHPGTRLLTCSWPYDMSHAWDTSQCPQDAPDMPNGVFMPFGTSPDMPNIGLANPQAGRNRWDTTEPQRHTLQLHVLAGHAMTCLGDQTRRSACRKHA